MRLRAALAIVLRQFYLMRGNPTRILPMFAWVAIDIVLWGFITRYLNSVGTSGIDFVPQLLGAVLFWDFFTRVMQGVTMAFFEDIWSRNFMNVFASPLTIPEYVSGLLLTSLCTSGLGLLAMLALAIGVFGLQFAALGAWLLPCLLVLVLFGIALGILASGIVLRLGPSAEWLIWPIPALLAPFAAVFYPVATLPVWMQKVALVLPPSYVFEAMRALVRGGAPAPGGLLAAAAIAVAQVLLAAWAFRGIHRYTVRTGLLARYSAESSAP